MTIVTELNPHVQALHDTIEMINATLKDPNITAESRAMLFVMLAERTDALNEIEQMEDPTPAKTRPLLKKIFKMM